jgi:type III pantothenate kinase
LGVDWFYPVAQACGVINGYDDPEQLGADRWAALIAARSMAIQGACIMDVGTAISIDGLDGQGVHLGGVIFPGTELLRNVVRDSLARVSISNQFCETSRIPARNTNDAVTAGINYGIGEVVKGLGKRMAAVCPQGSRMMVTGGGSSAFLPSIADDGWELCEDLVLIGVARIAQENIAN